MTRYLVTGGAGFIGSAVVRAALERGGTVRVLDDLSTGRAGNLSDLGCDVDLIEGSINDFGLLSECARHADVVVHLAAVPSVPRSVADPVASNRANVEGTLNVFLAARDAGVARVIYASSSSVYGDVETMPAHEGLPLRPKSPYAVTKAAGEWYGAVFADLYGLDAVGMRFFNVFGPRQDPDSPYAAVIPSFIRSMLRGKPPAIHGDGGQSRDFTYVDNVVDGILAAAAAPGRVSGVYNLACGASTSLLDLTARLNTILGTALAPVHVEARPGDIRQSWADISKAQEAFEYTPVVGLDEGLARTADWLRATETTA